MPLLFRLFVISRASVTAALVLGIESFIACLRVFAVAVDFAFPNADLS